MFGLLVLAPPLDVELDDGGLVHGPPHLLGQLLPVDNQEVPLYLRVLKQFSVNVFDMSVN